MQHAAYSGVHYLEPVVLKQFYEVTPKIRYLHNNSSIVYLFMKNLYFKCQINNKGTKTPPFYEHLGYMYLQCF